VKAQDRQGALGIVQGETALSRIEHHHGLEGDGEGRNPYDFIPEPFVPEVEEETK
jgi:hypothetical protein